MCVRPGFPVTPDNAATELPAAVKAFTDAGLIVGVVSAQTTLNNADDKEAKQVFEAAAKAEVPAVKIGYFPLRSPFDENLKTARTRMEGASPKLAEKTKVRALYHTHSGANIGNNAASLRWLLLDSRRASTSGGYVDTGHMVVVTAASIRTGIAGHRGSRGWR